MPRVHIQEVEEESGQDPVMLEGGVHMHQGDRDTSDTGGDGAGVWGVIKEGASPSMGRGPPT